MLTTVNKIPLDAFKNIKAKLDAYPANSIERSVLAIKYIEQYNLPKKVSDEDLLYYYFNGPTDQSIWRWLYLVERSIPYYTEKQPEYHKRLLYFPGTYIMEHYLNRRTFNYHGYNVMLRFTDISGDHDNVFIGPGDDTPDFYIYTDDTKFVDYKFASKNRFYTIDAVCAYYQEGKHMHKARLLLSFLEAEERFYLIDLDTSECYLLPIEPPNTYISTETIDSYVDPLDLEQE